MEKTYSYRKKVDEHLCKWEKKNEKLRKKAKKWDDLADDITRRFEVFLSQL